MAIHTLSVEITYSNGETLNPIYECHSEEKFNEFVAWHEANLAVGTTAVLKGFDYNTSTPEMVRFVAK